MIGHFSLAGMVAVDGAVILMSLAGIARAAEPPTAQTVFWHEAEIGVQAPDSIGPPTAQRDAASGGAYLMGGATLSKKGNAVSYELELPHAIDGAQIIFRYARLHWRQTMVPAHIGVEITSGGEALKGEAEFPNTGGWGYKPSEWQLAAAKMGSVKAGKCTIKLTGLGDDNDVVTDGFFIAPEGFKITAAELALTALAITSDGYVGLQSGTTVNQQANPVLRVAARSFSKEPRVTLAIGKTADSAAPLKAAGADAGENGAVLMKFELPPKLDDGKYAVVATGQWPQCRIVVPVVLAGQFLGSLDQKMQALEAFATELAKSPKADDVRCSADFQHLMEYLKAKGELLTKASVAPVDVYKQGLAAQEGVPNPAPLVDDMRRALAQGEETMRRLKAGQDPYAGRVGDLRRAYRSAASGELRIYRVEVPSGYEKADKVPFILMLHGGGQDENYFPTLDDGKLLKMLDSRGYLMASPRYASNSPSFVADMVQLIELMRKEYPKIDPARIYCTGLSMGGFGTYTMATTHPELFAAICCVSGTGRPQLAEQLKTVPTLILQGGTDEVVPPAGAKRVEARMKELGETVELHIFPINGHDYHGEEYLKLTLDFFGRYSKQGNSAASGKAG
ncbi:MAG: prolyl oligopeptidase family serine peptidase [Candidatus Brocadiia bacterium]|jgi:dienelactone hydrolase